MEPNKRKILNDPVYGFISIPDELIFDIIEHPFFQRLRRIKQLGLTHMVYPGALHTRFHHAIGTMYLMNEAIEVLRSKGQDISDTEAQAVIVAILLHDIGHGPFSHALENSIVYGLKHEDISNLFMKRLNDEFDGKLSLAIEIFQNRYHKKFLHQLVSGQLDVDRLDYLKRDSFFTGVSEGVISAERIIKMLNIVDDNLVIEAKGIYSIEKFLIARRLMYWQVYLHKTVLSAENLLIKILKRAKFLCDKGTDLFATPAFKEFLYHRYSAESFAEKPELLDTFALLDDFDIYTSIKVWCNSTDPILSLLCTKLVNRNLFHISVQNKPFDEDFVEEIRNRVQLMYGISHDETSYFVISEQVQNNAYSIQHDNINILYKNGSILDIAEASDLLNIQVLSKSVTKYFLCYPKECK
jgi:uncharacterized protein